MSKNKIAQLITENIKNNEPNESFDILEPESRSADIKRMKSAKWIPIKKLIADPDQPRKNFIDASLKEMALSISQYGVRQPIVVEYDKDTDQYRIVSGERRYRASKIAGIDELPCIIQEKAENTLRYAQQLVENIHREDFCPIDKAKAMIEYKKLLGEVPWAEVEKQLGISESRRKQFIALLNLPQEIQQEIVSIDRKPSKNQITEKHARALLALKQMPEKQNELFELIRNSEDPISGDEAIKKAKQMQGKKTFQTFKVEYINDQDLIKKLEQALSFLNKKLKGVT